MLVRVARKSPTSLRRFFPYDDITCGRPNPVQAYAATCSSPAAASRSWQFERSASSSSSARWLARQKNDYFARNARVAGLKSRAAYKLLSINDKYRLFKPGKTVVDLGFAPGSWSEVARNKTGPGGRVVGIDIIPAQPPPGVSTLQGDFLSAEIRDELRRFVRDPVRGRARQDAVLARKSEEEADAGSPGVTGDELEAESKGYRGREKELLEDEPVGGRREVDGANLENELRQGGLDAKDDGVVDVVLSDMMMNTSGISLRDHAGSMNLCLAALEFAYDTLITGGHFVCKFYQGADDRAFEMKLRKLFEKVHREKPDASRKESKEAYFVGIRRKANVSRIDVLDRD